MKKAVVWLLSALLLVGAMVPGFAQASQISPWAVSDLNDGERYGLYTTDWYTSDFNDQVTVEKLSFLRENLMKRFDEAGFKRKETFALKAIEAPLTRGAVAMIYYDVLDMYNFVESLETTEALERLNVLKGTQSGLELDNPCSTQQAVVMAVRLMRTVFANENAGAKGIMWKVENKDITLYLLGTIHTGNNFIYPMANRVNDALAASDALVVEALMTQDELAKFQAQLYYPEGKSIYDDLSKETAAKLEKVLAMDGIKLEDVKNIRAWHLMNQYTQAMLTVLSSTAQPDAGETTEGSVSIPAIDHGQSRVELGIDGYLMSRATLTGKPMLQLESLEQQAILFNGLKPETVDKNFSSILDFFLMTEEERAKEIAEASKDSESVDLVKTWLTLWQKGDVEGFTESFRPSIGEDEMSKMLFGLRDEEMAKRLQTLLESGEKGTYFVAVGSGHYVGEKSIIFNLKNMGYTVEVVQ